MKSKAQCANCKDIIESQHKHDFVTCKCGLIFVDGGEDYFRAGGNMSALIDLTHTDEDTKIHNIYKLAAWEKLNDQ